MVARAAKGSRAARDRLAVPAAGRLVVAVPVVGALPVRRCSTAVDSRRGMDGAAVRLRAERRPASDVAVLRRGAVVVAVGVRVGPAVRFGVGLAVRVGVGPAVRVGVGPAVRVGLGLAVAVAVGLGLAVAVVDAVAVGVVLRVGRGIAAGLVDEVPTGNGNGNVAAGLREGDVVAAGRGPDVEGTALTVALSVGVALAVGSVAGPVVEVCEVPVGVAVASAAPAIPGPGPAPSPVGEAHGRSTTTAAGRTSPARRTRRRCPVRSATTAASRSVRPRTDAPCPACCTGKRGRKRAPSSAGVDTAPQPAWSSSRRCSTARSTPLRALRACSYARICRSSGTSSVLATCRMTLSPVSRS